MWMDNPQAAMHELVEEIRLNGLFEPVILDVETGKIILTEDKKNKNMYLLLEGGVYLYKSVEQQGTLPVTKITPGGMFGVISFFSGKKALTTAIAISKSRILSLNKSDVDLLLNSDNIIAGMSRQLLISNLMERYSQVVDLNVKLNQVNTKLDEERIRLDEALSRLQDAHQRLIHQEKMATLGQLVAGIAHEINNPAAALNNAADYLVEILPELFEKNSGPGLDLRTLFYTDGLATSGVSTEQQRAKLNEAENFFPQLKRADLRKLIALSEESQKQARKLYDGRKIDELIICLKYAEAGMHLRSVRITSGRISNLVKSLKRYSRHETTSTSTSDIREGLLDTIHILGNRLKNIQMEVHLPENIPSVKADAAELNQVWTNILVNACDAINDNGRIYIRCNFNDKVATVIIGDDGPGIPEENRAKIFTPHFTTRNSTGNFGLGLGLSISKDLLMKNGGNISVGSSSYGGAEFKIEIPLN